MIFHCASDACTDFHPLLIEKELLCTSHTSHLKAPSEAFWATDSQGTDSGSTAEGPEFVPGVSSFFAVLGMALRTCGLGDQIEW